MKVWLWSLAMLGAAACLTPALAHPKPHVAAGAPAQSADARDLASDADVGAARRDYRAQCSRARPAAYCDCMTGGMAQALAPADLRAAAAAFAGHHPSADQMTRISAAAADIAPLCESLR